MLLIYVDPCPLTYYLHSMSPAIVVADSFLGYYMNFLSRYHFFVNYSWYDTYLWPNLCYYRPRENHRVFFCCVLRLALTYKNGLHVALDIAFPVDEKGGILLFF